MPSNVLRLPVPTISIAQSKARFPVRRIFCVGQNYADHAREMGSAPVGALARGVPPDKGAITLTIDGDVRQSGDLKDMIWSVADIIAILSTYVALAPGDLIFTGTPAGVGPIQRGELVRGTIAGIDPIELAFY
jgi:2-keto-4-pentenoate hydratase/2-oxohepta-3-ene-1,7-dioic acid hydratase in catechol pathway